ncbi:MAG: hypothetical protein LUD72_10425 [Bacteroidales bacterium]|nr:hypothetical protein [Bacteroidales bacterium]
MGSKDKNTQESAERFYELHDVRYREKAPFGYGFPMEHHEGDKTVTVRLSDSTTPMPYID